MGNGNGTVLSQEGEGNSVKETSLMMEMCERERERERKGKGGEDPPYHQRHCVRFDSLFPYKYYSYCQYKYKVYLKNT
jgi:hypothetical protein